MEQRVLPHSLDAERSVLGAILINNAVFPAAAEVVQAADFFRDGHKRLFECIDGLLTRGVEADLVTVKESLERNGLLDDAGGFAYVSALVDGVPHSTNVAYYAAIVKAKAQLRQIIFDGNRTVSAAYAEEVAPADLARAGMDRLALVEAGGAKVGPSPVVVTLDTVRPEAIRWLWAGRLAFGKLTMLSGDPGLGKSFITIDLAARASTGRPWPDGSSGRDPINVLIIAAEDGLGDTVRPRLDALGGDPSRVHVMTGTRRGRVESGPQLADVEAIERALTDTGARLLVIDPVSSYLGETDSHKDADVRGLLTPLLTMAARLDCAVLGVMHLTKDGGKSALYRSSGSIAFVGLGRVALMVTSDRENPDRRVLASSKINIAKMPDALAYTLKDGVLQWEDQPVAGFDLDAHLAAASSSGARDNGEQTDAERIIAELLDDDSAWPVAAKTVEQLAKDHGVNYRTLQRAAGTRRIRIQRLGFGPGSRVVWHRPAIDDRADKYGLETNAVSSMSPMSSMDASGANHGGKNLHTYIEDSNGPFPRAREDDPAPAVSNGGGRVSL